MNLEKFTEQSMYDHSYNINVAKDVGVCPAVIFNHILECVRANKRINSNFHNGKHWMKFTRSAKRVFFPEFTESQIKRAISLLKENGYIVNGIFNEDPFDRTQWYSLSDSAEKVFLSN